MNRKAIAAVFAVWAALVGALGVGAARHAGVSAPVRAQSHALGDFGSGAFWSGTVIPTALPPSGAAGGYLAGSYPNPTFLADAGILSGLAAGGSLNGTYPNPGYNLDAGTGVLPTPNQATQATFYYQPGGIASSSLFTTWSSLYTAASAVNGPVFVIVDDSISSAHITSGGPYNLDEWTIIWKSNDVGAGTLTVDTGATFSFKFLNIVGLFFQNSNTSTPCTINDASGFFYLSIYGDGPELLSTTSAALLRLQAGTFVIQTQNGTLGDGNHPVLTVDTGKNAGLLIYQKSVIAAHALTGAGTINANLSGDTSFNATQDVSGTLNKNFVQLSSQTAYTPNLNSNWNSVPSVISNALDTLASPLVPTPTSIACGTGGTQTVAANPTKDYTVTSGTLSSNCVIDFGTNATNGLFHLDMSGVTLGATFGVQFKNGTATKTFLSSGVIAGTMAIVMTTGPNTLAVNF